MKAVFVIAQNTFREIIRDRILYGLIIFAVLLIGISIALGQLSFSEQGRISANFGFTAIHLSSIVLAIFVGSTLVAREIDKRTIFSLLVRPINRHEFLLGKFFGLISIMVMLMLSLSLILGFVLYQLEMPWGSMHSVAIWGVFLESLIILSAVLLFGVFVKPLLTVIFSISIFLIGHWVKDLDFFAGISKSRAFRFGASAISTVVPNLERLNWRGAPVASETVPMKEIVSSSSYAVAWILVLLGITMLLFRKKDFS